MKNLVVGLVAAVAIIGGGFTVTHVDLIPTGKVGTRTTTRMA